MATYFDGTEVDAITMDGTALDNLIIDGTEVWEKYVPPSWTPSHTLTISSYFDGNYYYRGFSDFVGYGSISPTTAAGATINSLDVVDLGPELTFATSPNLTWTIQFDNNSFSVSGSGSSGVIVSQSVYDYFNNHIGQSVGIKIIA